MFKRFLKRSKPSSMATNGVTLFLGVSAIGIAHLIFRFSAVALIALFTGLGLRFTWDSYLCWKAFRREE